MVGGQPLQRKKKIYSPKLSVVYTECYYQTFTTNYPSQRYILASQVPITVMSIYSRSAQTEQQPSITCTQCFSTCIYNKAFAVLGSSSFRAFVCADKSNWCWCIVCVNHSLRGQPRTGRISHSVNRQRSAVNIDSHPLGPLAKHQLVVSVIAFELKL